jgi:hypothetical protein
VAKVTYEVQTRFLYGWDACWSVDDAPETFDTEQQADDAITEFFADLGRAGMAQLYDRGDYRVARVDEGAGNQ